MARYTLRQCAQHCLLLALLPCQLLIGDDPELRQLVRQAWAESPKVKAARQRVEQYLARHEELEGFGDPTVFAAAGTAERTRSVPGSTSYRALTNNATDVQGGVEMALRPGAYVSLGAAERWYDNPAGQDGYFQTLVGLRVRIPLGKDRGFLQWDLDRSVTLAEYHATLAELTTVLQTLRHDTEKAYLTLQGAYALASVASEATQRFQKLYDETTELVRLKVVAEYQIAPALMELELRRADEVLYQRQIEAAVVALRRVVGKDVTVTGILKPEELVAWAMREQALRQVDMEAALETRGNYRQVLAQLQAARAEVRRVDDDLRPDVALHLGTTWQGEHESLPVGWDHIASDKHIGGEVTLVYTRPLGFRAENAQRARWHARLGELNARLQDVAVTIRAELRNAEVFFRRAAERMAIIGKAREAALATLDAESERFRLGEGRSRNVLDAQKDLTTINQRLTQVATELLGARMDYDYATGYGQDELRSATGPQANQKETPNGQAR